MQETKCTDDKFPTLCFRSAVTSANSLGSRRTTASRSSRVKHATRGHRGYPGDDESAQSRLITTTSTASISSTSTFRMDRQVGSEKYAFKLGGCERLREFFDATTIRKRRCCCVAISTSRRKSATCTTCDCGRDASCSANRSTHAFAAHKDWGFTDAFRLHTEAGGHFTWWDYRAGAFRRNLGSADRSRVDQ
jgi:exodeoxyribonuclease-3